MSSNNEYLYSYVLRIYNRDDVSKINDLVPSQEGLVPASARINQQKLKRMVGLLSNEARVILIFRLITYLYIRSLLRFLLFVFFLLFQYHHFTQPEMISSMMNESFLIRAVWSNYYTNTDFITSVNSNTKDIGIQLKEYARENIKLTTNDTNDTNIQSNSKKIQLSNSSMQVVFVNNNIFTQTLPLPVTIINNTMMLVDFAKHIYASSIYASSIPSLLSQKSLKSEIKSTIKKQIIVNKQMPPPPEKPLHVELLKGGYVAKPPPPVSQRANKKTINKIKKLNSKNKKNSKQIYKFDINDSVYGYVIVDKRIVIIYDNGITYFYKVSQAFIDKYLE